MSDENPSLSYESVEFLERTLFNAILDGGLDQINTETESDEEDVITGMSEFSLVNLKKEIENIFQEVERETAEELEDVDSEYRERIKGAKLSQRVSPLVQSYFTINQEIIDEISANLLREKLIEERYREANKTEKIIQNRFDQELREDLLLRTGIIENSLKSEMTHVRRTRNKVVHDLKERVLLTSDEELFSEIERSASLRRDLREELTDEDDLIELPVGER